MNARSRASASRLALLVLGVAALAHTACGTRDRSEPASATPVPPGAASSTAAAAPIAARSLVPDGLVDCTPDRWCRLPGLVPGDQLLAATRDGTGGVWAIGQAGLVVRWDGKQLASWRHAAHELVDVWADPTSAWISTRAGVVLVYAADRWQELAADDRPLGDIAGTPGGPVWVIDVASDVLRIERDHTVTRVARPSDRHVNALWAAAPDDLWAVVNRGGGKIHWAVMRWNGKAWRDMRAPFRALPVGSPAPALAGTGTGDVWVLAYHLAHWDGKTWTEAHDMTGSLLDVLARDQVVAGNSSALHHFDGERWTTRRSFHGLFALALGDGRVLDGRLRIVDAAGAETWLPIGLELDARVLWAGPDALWIAGSERGKDRLAVARWDGARWSYESLAAADGSAIAGLSRPWIGAWDGSVWRHDGATWHRETTGLGHIRHLAVLTDDVVWAADNVTGALARRDAQGWHPVALGAEEIEALASGAGHIFVVRAARAADTAELARWDGARFVAVATVPTDVVALLVRGERDVDIIGRRSGLHRWRGAAISTTSLTGTELSAAISVDGSLLALGRSSLERHAGVVTLGDQLVWQDLPASQLGNLAARDGTLWVMQDGSGDLYVRAPARR